MSFNFDGDGQSSRRVASSSAGFDDSDYSFDDADWGSNADSGGTSTDLDGSGSAASGFTLDGDGSVPEVAGDHWQGTTMVPPGKPPMKYFYVGLGLSLLGVVVAFLLQQSWFGLALGWLLAGPIAILALGQYVERDSAQRTRPIYQGGATTRHYPVIMGAVALACVVVVAVLAAGKAALAW